MKFEKSCGAVIYKENEQEGKLFLVIQMNHGHFSFPKGHVEKGETEFETAKREVLEETNLEINIVEGFREVVTYSPYEGVSKDVVFFLAKPLTNDIQIQNEELQLAEYFPTLFVEGLLTFESDKQVFRSALKFIDDHFL